MMLFSLDNSIQIESGLCDPFYYEFKQNWRIWAWLHRYCLQYRMKLCSNKQKMKLSRKIEQTFYSCESHFQHGNCCLIAHYGRGLDASVSRRFIDHEDLTLMPTLSLISSLDHIDANCMMDSRGRYIGFDR